VAVNVLARADAGERGRARRRVMQEEGRGEKARNVKSGSGREVGRRCELEVAGRRK
jgi:hypothetical protein